MSDSTEQPTEQEGGGESNTVSIQGLGETGQTATVDERGRISVGRKYKGQTIKYAFEVIEDE